MAAGPGLAQGKCKRIRITNLLERSSLERRRRTKSMPRLFVEKGCLKLVFATLWRASQSWRNVRMSEFEIQQLRLIRRELRLLVGNRPERIVGSKVIAA